MFDKSQTIFPVRQDNVYLAHCAIGPMYGPAARAACDFIEAHSKRGVLLRERYGSALTTFRDRVAAFLEVDADDISYVSNTAEGVGLITNGYSFEPGDQVISYVHEFPSNHYPWALQSERGVELVLLSDVDPIDDLPPGPPRGWSMEELEARTTERTCVIALSHVQFTSGYAADLQQIGHFCRERGIDLVIDAAQSLGVLPVYPREHGISAVVSSVWKWLLASWGAGLALPCAGVQTEVEDHDGGQRGHESPPRLPEPRMGPTRRRSSLRIQYPALGAPREQRDRARRGLPPIRDRGDRDGGLSASGPPTRRDRHGPFPSAGLHAPPPISSGILSVRSETNASRLVDRLQSEGIIATAQAGYLRLAPHFYQTHEDIERAAKALGRLA